MMDSTGRCSRQDITDYDDVNNKYSEVVEKHRHVKEQGAGAPKSIAHEVGVGGGLGGSAESEKNLERGVREEGQEDDGSNAHTHTHNFHGRRQGHDPCTDDRRR